MIHRPCRYAWIFAALLALSPAIASARSMGSGVAGASQGSDNAVYDADKAMDAGLKAMDQHHYRDAAEIFVKILAIDPKQPLVLFELGQSQAGLGRLHYAQGDYEDSLKVDPNAIPPARELAIVDVKLGHPDKAMALLGELKTRSAACAGTCPDAASLAEAIAAVEAVLPAGAAAAPASSKP